MRRTENLQKLKQRRLRELKARDRSRIDKKKYYGVKVEIKDYFNEIYKTFYDPELYEELITDNVQEEALRDYFANYLTQISARLTGITDKIDQYLRDSFEKGSRRILDKEGDTISIKQVQDTKAIDFLINQQVLYLKGLTDDQTKLVTQTIAKGRNEGKTSLQISEDLQKKLKNLTRARANTIARTEVVKSHNIGQVQTMKELGVDTYRYITANDKKVAAICQKNQGPKGRERIYDLDKAGTPRNPLPVYNSHPNCRCTIVVDSYK